MTVSTIMTEDEALESYKKIIEELNVVNLDDICDGNDEKTKSEHKRILQAIRCGLITFDSENKHLIQKFIKPLQSGNLDPKYELVYQNKLTLKDMEEIPAGRGLESLKQMIAQITNCPANILHSMGGIDFEIAMSCTDFFAQ